MSAIDSLQFYISCAVLTIVASSIAIVALSFWPGSTSRQITLISELSTSAEHARRTCERGLSAALWSAGDAGQFVGMGDLSSIPPEAAEDGFVDQANQLVQELAAATADEGDFRASTLRRRLADTRRIEAAGIALLSALEAGGKLAAIDTQPQAIKAAHFQQLKALQ